MADTEEFEGRKLRLGICPQCNNLIGELIEVRKSDGKERFCTYKKRKLDRLMKEEKSRINYTSQDVNKNSFKKKLSGGCMGLIQQSGKKPVWYR